MLFFAERTVSHMTKQPTQGDLAPYLFHQGTNYHTHDYLGVHILPGGETVFRLWAPGADHVCLVGDFCDWNQGIPMVRTNDGGIWEVTLRAGHVKVGQPYTYRIHRAFPTTPHMRGVTVAGSPTVPAPCRVTAITSSPLTFTSCIRSPGSCMRTAATSPGSSLARSLPPTSSGWGTPILS